MNAVFLDTVGMLALWDEADQWHALAKNAHPVFRVAKSNIFTTIFVLAECGNAAARRGYRSAVVQWRDVMTANNGLITPTREDWTEAWRAYERGEAGDAGIVDQISFAVMRRLGIQRVFTNDEHFRAAGFETLF